jgi:hypothetical protein
MTTPTSTTSPPPPVLRATMRSEAVHKGGHLDREPQGHDHRHCSFLTRKSDRAGCRATLRDRPHVRHASESLGQRDCARNGHAGTCIGSAVAARCDRARPPRGTASTGTGRSNDDDQSSWHARRSRRSRPHVPRNHGARSPGKPGPNGRDGPTACPLPGQEEPRRPSRSGASAADTAPTPTGSTGRLGRPDVVSPLVDKPWSDRVGGHPVDTPAL